MLSYKRRNTNKHKRRLRNQGFKKMMFSSLLRTRAIVTGLVAWLLATNWAMAANAPLKAGDLPPPTLGKTAKGQPVQLADYVGKVVIISFWATWCPPCRKELPILGQIQKQIPRSHLAVFAVNWKEDRSRFREVVRTLKDMDLDLVSDEYGSYGKQYGVTAIPHMILIGRDGRIANIHVGYGDSELNALADEINELLRATPPPHDVTVPAEATGE